MSVEESMVTYYASRAREYERIYQKPERQEDLRWLRDFIERTFAGANVCKNFPTVSELHAAVDGLAADVRVEFRSYFWIMSYVPRVILG